MQEALAFLPDIVRESKFHLVHFSNLFVFDLDHTLLRTNCSYRFGVFLYQQRLVSRLKLTYALLVYITHRCFNLPLHKLHQKIFDMCFKNMEMSHLEKAVDSFLELNLQEMLDTHILKKLQMIQKEGHYTLLLSNSPDFLVKSIANKLTFSEWAATCYQVGDHGRLTNIKFLLEGHTKADFTLNRAKQLNISPSNIYAYSDSYLDLPLLKCVGKPIAVNPDRKLRQYSLTKGWEIVTTNTNIKP
ncbi:MAG: hypothetical protein K0S74_593 [Chlamydiales bacterium]|jgi:HAD superfamily hydrolase (TIGR01490 family)|nr:hypothetical protein [Chlamydiales bacterium]